MPEAEDHSTGYPKNEKIVVYMKKCIESFKELADYGATVGVKITIENHWGLCANPMNIRIIMDEVNHLLLATTATVDKTFYHATEHMSEEEQNLASSSSGSSSSPSK